MVRTERLVDKVEPQKIERGRAPATAARTEFSKCWGTSIIPPSIAPAGLVLARADAFAQRLAGVTRSSIPRTRGAGFAAATAVPGPRTMRSRARFTRWPRTVPIGSVDCGRTAAGGTEHRIAVLDICAHPVAARRRVATAPVARSRTDHPDWNSDRERTIELCARDGAVPVRRGNNSLARPAHSQLRRSWRSIDTRIQVA